MSQFRKPFGPAPQQCVKIPAMNVEASATRPVIELRWAGWIVRLLIELYGRGPILYLNLKGPKYPDISYLWFLH